MGAAGADGLLGSGRRHGGATTTGVTAFSMVKGEFSSTVNGTFAITTNDAMVWADGGTVGWAYAAIQGKWVQAPVPLAGQQVSVIRNGVVLAGSQDYLGFSGRSGTWVSQACTTPFVYTATVRQAVYVEWPFGGSVTHQTTSLVAGRVDWEYLP